MYHPKNNKSKTSKMAIISRRNWCDYADDEALPIIPWKTPTNKCAWTTISKGNKHITKVHKWISQKNAPVKVNMLDWGTEMSLECLWQEQVKICQKQSKLNKEMKDLDTATEDFLENHWKHLVMECQKVSPWKVVKKISRKNKN